MSPGHNNKHPCGAVPQSGDIDRFRSIDPGEQKQILRHIIAAVHAHRGEATREVDIPMVWQDSRGALYHDLS